MRYKIVAFETPEFKAPPHTIYDPAENKHVVSAKLTQKINAIDDLVITVNKDSWLYNKSNIFIVHVNVYNLSNENELTFRGRLIKTERKMTSSGEFVQELTFESIMGYLLDTLHYPSEDDKQSKTAQEFMNEVVSFHNDMVDPDKKIYFDANFLDETIPDDEAGNKHKYDVDTTSSWEAIKNEVLDRLGLYMRSSVFVRDGKYVNLLEISKDIGEKRNTAIEIGVNMQSASVSVDPSNLFTCLIPLGATVEDAEKSERTKARYIIGKTEEPESWVIENKELINKFGYIYKSHVWEDVTDTAELKRLGEEYMAKQIIAINNWQVDTFETDDVTFYVGDKYKFVNDEIAISQYLRIMEKEIDITSPNNVTVKIESTNSNLTDFQLEQLRMNKQITELQREKSQDKRKIDKLIEKIDQLKRDQLVGAGSGQTVAGGPTHAVNGDWGPAIKHASDLMNANATDEEIAHIKNVIQHESGGSETVVNMWDSNAQAGHPSKGLLQYIDSTFMSYALEGHTNILAGFDQILALFNDSSWRSDLTLGGWGPRGSRLYSKVPNSEADASGGAKRLQDEARKYLGIKYVWGGNRPIGSSPRSGMDCSSFVAQVYKDLGISVPAYAVTTSLEPMGHQISRSQVQAGDMGFYGSHGASYHVTLALDNKRMIYEPAPGQSCMEQDIDAYPPTWWIRNDDMARIVAGN